LDKCTLLSHFLVVSESPEFIPGFHFWAGLLPPHSIALACIFLTKAALLQFTDSKDWAYSFKGHS